MVAVLVYGGAEIYSRTQTNNNGPEIQMEEREVTVSIAATEEEIMSGVTAEDKKDGDVTDSLVIESMGNFFEKGKRKVTMAAFDSDNNVAKAERTIVYSNYISPRIVAGKPWRAPVNKMDELMSGLSATDCLEGDITNNLQLTLHDDTKNTTTPGECSMKVTVSNSVGDTVEIPVTVDVYDYAAEGATPLPLLSQYLVYLKKDQGIDPAVYLQGIRVRNQEYFWDETYETPDGLPPVDRSQVTIQNNVDSKTPGTYEIRYTAHDDRGNTGSVRLFVVVEE